MANEFLPDRADLPGDHRRAMELCAIIESAPVPLIAFDRSQRLSCANAAARKMWKLPAKGWEGKRFSAAALPAAASRIGETRVNTVMATGRDDRAELRWRDVDGEHVCEAFFSPRRDENGAVAGVIMACADTTARDKTRAARFHDPLTGLYNRAFFEEEVRRFDTDRALPVAFIMGNANNVALTNDIFGIQEGDMLLIRIARILKSCCRSEDLVARWGEDEFVILLPCTDLSTAEEIAGRIRRRCAESPGAVIPPGISLGVSVKHNGHLNIYRVLRLAERRMYRDKRLESRNNRRAVIDALMARMRGTHPELSDHIRRLQQMIRLLGKDLGLTPEGIEKLMQLAYLHDIGTALVSDQILRKQGKLTQREWESVMKHSEAGYRIVRSFGDPMQPADTVLAHHERWDGKGYPRGLRGNEIPLPARILSILTAYDTMTHDRIYRRKLSHGEALDELEKCAGNQFDPALVSIFVKRMRQELSPSLPLEMLIHM